MQGRQWSLVSHVFKVALLCYPPIGEKTDMYRLYVPNAIFNGPVCWIVGVIGARLMFQRPVILTPARHTVGSHSVMHELATAPPLMAAAHAFTRNAHCVAKEY